MIHTTDLYFESHVTIDPVASIHEGVVDALAKTYGFRVAELLMKKTLEPSDLDSFMTTRSKDFEDIMSRTQSLVHDLQTRGFKVRRWKIENTLLDVRL